MSEINNQLIKLISKLTKKWRPNFDAVQFTIEKHHAYYLFADLEFESDFYIALLRIKDVINNILPIEEFILLFDFDIKKMLITLLKKN